MMASRVLRVLGLTAEMVRGADRKAWTARLLLAGLVLTFSMPRVNIGSIWTGVALIVALLRTFDLIASHRTLGWRSALLLGGLLVAAATLRGHFIFVEATLSLSFVLWRLMEGEQKWSKIIREAILTLVFATLFISSGLIPRRLRRGFLFAPWVMATYDSNQSLFYPLLKGTLRNGFDNFSRHLSLLSTLQFVGGFYVSTHYLLLFVPCCFLKPGREKRALLFAGVAILILSTAFLSQLYAWGLLQHVSLPCARSVWRLASIQQACLRNSTWPFLRADRIFPSGTRLTCGMIFLMKPSFGRVLKRRWRQASMFPHQGRTYPRL